MMMKRIKHSSLGDYITTLCFFGLTILSFVKANEVLNEEKVVQKDQLKTKNQNHKILIYAGILITVVILVYVFI